MMVIENKFNFGDLVYLSTDPDQKQRIVVAICVRPGFLEYQLATGDQYSWHQEFVISAEKDVLKTTTN